MTSRCSLIKIGGSVAEDEGKLHEIARALVEIKAAGRNVVLVHGGGADISRNLRLIDESPEFIDGLRVTSPRALSMVEMTLSGYMNKKLVGIINKHGCRKGVKAAGISGVDASTLVCAPVSERLGRVGRVDKVDTGLIESLLSGGYMPVVSPISVDSAFEHYNVNADEAAGALAAALGAEKLLFLSDVPGVLDEKKERLPILSIGEMEALMESGVVTGGMVPKLKSCISVLEAGVGEIHICGWEGGDRFRDQVLSGKASGTVLTK
ncbi:acetylglutamate kinase [Fibrobacterota bacterium]